MLQTARSSHLGARKLVVALALLCSTAAWGTSPLPTVERLAPGGDDSSPIVLALHGFGDTPANFAKFVAPMVPGARVIAVRAPSARSQGGFSWYRIGSDQAPADVADATARVADLLRSIAQSFPNAGRPIVIGFSQGAVMGYSLAARHPDLVRGVVAIAGYLIPESLPIRKTTAPRPNLLIVHGKADTVVPYARGLKARRRFDAAGYPLEFVSHPGKHRVDRTATLRIREWLARHLFVTPRSR